MRSLRKSLPAAAGLVLAAALVVANASPALAAPPYPAGGQGTALVGGTPLVQATCTTAPAQASGNSQIGLIRVGTPAGAQCTPNAVSTNGQYSIDGTVPTTMRFSAQCVNSTGATNGLVDVPAGTNIAGVGVVTQQTTVTTLNTMVTYPGGSTAILNQVTTTPTSVTRAAITFTSGAATGVIVGRCTSGTPLPYPLSVDTAAAAPAPADLAALPLSGDSGGSSSNRVIYIGAALALLVLAQLTVGRTVLRRRRGATE
jgi:hypothetical protein